MLLKSRKSHAVDGVKGLPQIARGAQIQLVYVLPQITQIAQISTTPFAIG
jgi:hypothetical protein